MKTNTTQSNTVIIHIEAYKDKDGNPTCAIDFSEGKVCQFYRTQRWGCHETCLFAESGGQGKYLPPLRRRKNGEGTLIPMDGCPVWKNQD